MKNIEDSQPINHEQQNDEHEECKPHFILSFPVNSRKEKKIFEKINDVKKDKYGYYDYIESFSCEGYISYIHMDDRFTEFPHGTKSNICRHISGGGSYILYNPNNKDEDGKIITEIEKIGDSLPFIRSRIRERTGVHITFKQIYFI
jgi:hypothetical protein